MSQQHRDGADVDRAPVSARARRRGGPRAARRERARRVASATAGVVSRLMRRGVASLARAWAAARLDGLHAMRFEPLDARQMLDAVPLTFAPINPLGVQAYEARASGTLASTSQSDVYQVKLNDAGKLSFVASTTDASLRLHVVVTNDATGATVVAPLDAATGGATLSKQNLALAAGTYDVTVTADATPAHGGAYALRAAVNASVQAGAPTNTSTGTAASLAGSGKTLAGGGQQYAATGTAGASKTDSQYYKIDLTAGQFVSAALSGAVVGTGFYNAATTTDVLGAATVVATGDLDGDGLIDIVAGGTSPFGGDQGLITILKNNGDGTFDAENHYVTDYPVTSIAIGNASGDATRPDILVGEASSDPTQNVGGTVLIKNNGFGNYFYDDQIVAADAGARVLSVAIADLDGDGVGDLVSAGYGTNDDGTTYAYVGVGYSNDGGSTSITGGTAIRAMTVGDVNGDGNADLILAVDDGQGVEVRYGTGSRDGSAFNNTTNYGYGNTYDAVTFGDADGDGVSDIVALEDDSSNGNRTYARVVELDAGGNDRGEYDIDLGEGDVVPGASIYVGDVNSDGRPDLIATSGRGGGIGGYDSNNDAYHLIVARGDGDSYPSFNSQKSYPLTGAAGLAVADVTGDGRADLVTVSADDNTSDHPSAVEVLADAARFAGGAGTLRLIDPTGKVITTGLTADDAAGGIQSYVARTTGTYYLQVTGAANVDYALSVTRNAAIGFVPSYFNGRPADLTGATDLIGYVDQSGSDRGTAFEIFNLGASAGDTITLHFNAVPAGPNGAATSLGGFMQLNAPDDPNVDGDGGYIASDPSTITYTVPAGQGGTYSLYVLASSGAGLFDVTISGAHGVAPASTVDFSLPTGTNFTGNPNVNYGFPRPLYAYASQAVDQTSIDLSKFTLNGHAATSVNVVDQTRLEIYFDASADTGDGSYTAAIAAGAFKSLAGVANVAKSQTFTVDTGPKVTGADVHDGDVLAPGAQAFHFTFNKSLLSYVIFGSGGFGTFESILDASDFRAYNRTTDTYYTASNYQLGPDNAYGTPQENTTLAMQFANLPEGQYELRLSAGQFGFADFNDVPLDGDNDGYPYGDYVVNFNVDRSGATSLGKPTLLAPNAAQAYAFAPVVGAIDPDSDVDDYTFAAQAGDQFTAGIAVTAGYPQLRVDLLAPDGSVVATRSGGYGDSVSFQNVGLAVTGTYRVHVASAGQTGAYKITAYLNADVKRTAVGGDANDAIGTAQALDFGDANNGGIDRAVIVGTGADVTSGYYSLALAAGQRVSASIAISATAPAAAGGGASVTAAPTVGAKLALVDATGRVLALGVADATALNYTFNDFAAPAAGTYYVRVMAGPNYTLAVARDATFELEPNDAVGAPQDIGRTKRAAGYLAAGGDADGYTFNARAGDALTILTAIPDDVAAVGYNGLQTILRLYAPDGTLLTSNQGGAPGDANASRILYNVPNNAAGTYRVVVTAVGATSGTYALSVAGATGTPSVTSPSVVGAAAATGTVAAISGRLANAPTTITFVLSEAIDPTSVSAADLTLSAGTATGVRLVDGRTIEFTLSVPNVDSTVNYSLAAGAFSSLQGQPSAAYASSVVIDKFGPRVVSVTPATNALAPFTTITFTFNEALAPLPTTYYYQQFFTAFTAADGTNLLSAGYISNIVISGNTFTVTFYQQTKAGTYTLTLAPGLTDLVGNKQDQDGDGINGEATQDGYTASIVVGSPDLVVSSVQPATGAVYGTPTNVTWTVKNNGDATAAGSWVDKVYLSADGTYDGNDTLLGTFGAPGTLAPGASYTVTKPLTFPLTDTSAPGTMYVIVITNPTNTQVEGNTANDTTAAADAVALPPLVDLAVTDVTAPPNLVAGQSYVIHWTLRNVGDQDFTGSIGENINLSGDTTVGNDVNVGGTTFTGTIPAGGFVSRTATVTVPAGTSGAKYFVVEVNPYRQLFEHGSYANNSGIQAAPSNVTLAPAPDFLATNVKGPTTTSFSGSDVTFTWTDTNQGTSDFNGSFDEDLYLGKSADGSDAVYFKTVRFSGPIPIGGSVQRTATFTLPASFPAGNYYPFVNVDTSNEVYENPAGELNNSTRGAATIAVAVPSLPDLTVTNVKGPATALSGQDIPISWTDKNLGPNAVGGTWTDNVYLATDAAGTNLQYFGSFNVTANLAAGAGVNVAQTIHLDSTFTGTYYVVVQTDAGGQVFEANENNNQAVAAAKTVVSLAPYPNLIVSSVVVPPTAFSGISTTLSFFIKNVGTGPTSAPQWYDHIYLSTDATYDGTDKDLGAFLNPGYLDAGQTYKNTVNVTIPRGLAGTYYFIVQADTYDQVREFGPGGETDNYGSGATTQVTLTPAPDLRVTSVTAPTRAFSGSLQTVTWNVRNFGPGVTAGDETQWSDRVFLSSDNVLDATDLNLGTFQHTGGLNVDGSYTAQGAVALPTGVSGTFYYIVQADIYNQVFENGFENNNVTPQSTPTQITLTPPPDLAITSATAPATLVSGHTLSVNYVVANQGASATPNDSWYDSLYLSKTPTLDASAILVAQRGHSGALASGASYSNTIAGQVPYTLASGTYYAIVVTDAGNQVFELGEANNTLAASATAVTYAPPDLVVTTTTTPTSATAGGGFLASWTVRNQGAGDTAVDRWRDAVYLSTDSVLGDGDDVLLDSFDHVGLLAPGASYTAGNKSLVIPTSVASGNYYLLVSTDDGQNVFEGNGATAPGELNNVSAPQPITITRAAADLQVTSVGTLANATQGGSATVNFTVKNAGTGLTGANYWFDNVYLSPTPSLTRDYVLVSQVQHSNALAAGGQYDASATFTIPSTLALGTYYVVVATDATNRVEEQPLTNEQNNVTAGAAFTLNSGAEPDLAVSSVATSATATAGQTLNVTYTVTNAGTAAAAPIYGGTYDTVYLSLDQNLDPRTDVSLGSVYHAGNVAAGGSYTNAAAFTLPNGLAGVYYLFVVTDSPGRVTNDVNAANNTGQGAAPVTISIAPPTDIAIGTVTLPTPATGGLGLDLSLTYTVTNGSDVPAKGSWQDAVYLSKDGTYDANDALFGTITHTGDVAAGGSYTQTITGAVPGVNPGDYYVIVRTDIRNALSETTKANNVGASMGAISLSVPTLTAGVGATGSLSTGRSVYYKIDVPYGQTLYVTFNASNASAANELYLRYGQVPTRGVFDKSYSKPLSPNQSITVPLTKAGTYYVLAYGGSVPGGETYTLTASLPQFGVTDTTYGKGGTAGNLTLQINGAKFDRTTTATLTKNGVAVAGATAYYYTDQGRLYATFDLTKVAAGVYDVTLKNAAGATAVVADGLTVVAGGGGRLQKYINSPGAVRGTYSFQVDWSNDGLNDIGAPYLIVKSTGNVGVDPRYVNSPGYTFVGDAPDDGPAGVIRPGQTGTATYFSYNGPTIVSLGSIADPSSTFDYDQFRDELIAAGEPDASFDAAFARMKQDIGPTFGEALIALDRDATLMPGDLGLKNVVASLLQIDLARAKAELTTSLSGTVDAPDIAVVVANQAVYATNTSTGQVFSTTSLNDGSFVFANLTAGTYDLSFDGAVVAPATGDGIDVAAGGHVTGVRLGLTAGQSFAGTVRDAATGAPLSAADVVVVLPGGSTRTVVTDASGDYAFGGLPDGPYTIYAQADGYARSIQTFTPGPGLNPSDFSLARPDATVTGRLALPGGNAGAVTVTAQLNGVANLAGFFEASVVGDTFTFASLPAGTYTLTAAQDGSVGRRLTFTVAAGQAGDVGTITLVGDASIGGAVISADPSLSVAGLEIDVRTAVDGAPFATLRTDAAGGFRTDGLAAGTYTFHVVTRGGYAVDLTATVADAQQLNGQQITLRSGATIAGTVTVSASSGNAGGQALPGVRVTATGGDGSSYTTTSDAGGHYAFPHLRPGGYVVGVSGASVTIAVPATDGATVAANLSTAIAGTVTGRLVVGGQAAAGGVVVAYASGQPVATAIADADGSYRLYFAVAGTYDLIAQASGATFAPGRTSVSNGTSATANFTAGSGSIVARVTDARHPPANDFVFLKQYTAAGLIDVGSLAPGADGTASFAHLAAGRYQLSVGTPDGREAVTDVTVGGGATAVDLAAVPGSSIAGTIAGVAGGSAIVIAYRTANGVATSVGVATIGSDGSYAIAGLDDGTYDVVVTDVGYQTILRQGLVVANGAATFNVTLTPATAHLTGRLVDANGAPVSSGVAYVTDAAGHVLGATLVNADGSFAIDGASGADLRLTVSGGDYRPVVKTFAAGAGATTNVGDVRVGVASAISTGPSAAPVSGGGGGGGGAGTPTAALALAASAASASGSTATGAARAALAMQMASGGGFSVSDITNVLIGGIPFIKELKAQLGTSYSRSTAEVKISDLPPLDKCGRCIDALLRVGKTINVQELAYQVAKEQHDALYALYGQVGLTLAYDLIETAGVIASLFVLVDGILAASGAAVTVGGVYVTGEAAVGATTTIGLNATRIGYTLANAAGNILQQLYNLVTVTTTAATATDKGSAKAAVGQSFDVVTAITVGFASAFAAVESLIQAGANNFGNGVAILQSIKDYQGVINRLKLKDFFDALANLDDAEATYEQARDNYYKAIANAQRAAGDYATCVRISPDNACDGKVNSTDPADYISITVSLPPSKDPNDISGPAGFGPAGYVNAARPLGYTIEFENAADAEAPAQVIEVTQQLDSDLDYRTFRLGTIVLAGHAITPPDDVAFFQTRVDLTADLGVFVDVFAGVDVSTGQAFWDFTAIDPATGERPVDPRVGLLPPDIIAGEGQGFVNYTIRPLATATTGTTIAAAATIVFDENAPIDTPSVSNTLDLAGPQSQVAALPATTETAGGIALSWTGVDDANGSGIKGYTIYVSTDGGDYVAFLTDTTATSAVFNGAAGHGYRFYSVATDNSGNVEAAPTTPDAQTAVNGASATLAGLVASTTVTYGTPTATFAGNVTGATVAGETVAVTLNGKTVNATIDASGHFAATFDVTAINASATPYAVTYSYAGNDALGGATGATTLTVNKAALTVSVADATKTYGTANPTFAVSYSGFVNGQGASNLGGTPTVTTTEPATGYANVGSYAINVAGLSSDNYAITFVPGTLTVTRAALTITGETLYTTYGQPVPVPGAIYTGLAAGESGANLTTQPTVTTTATSTSAPGTYAVTVGGAASGNYAITYVAGAIIVAQATPVVTLGTPPSSIVYDGTTSVDAWATATLAKPDGTVGGAAAPTGDVILRFYRGTVVTGAPFFDPPVNAGVYTVVAFYAGDANYGATASAPITYTINKATPTLTLPTPPTNLTADGTTSVDAWAVPTLSGPSTAPAPTGPVTLTYYSGSTATGTALASPPTAAGTYTVVASYNGNSNYAAVVSAPQTFTVNPPAAALTTSLKVNDGAAQRSMVRSLTVTFSGPVTLAAGAITLVDANGNAVAFTLSTTDNANYVLTFAGAGFIGGSLANGRYTLVVHKSGVTGGGSLSADQTYNVFRLFGDSDGNGTVNNVESAAFKKAYNSTVGSAKYVDYFDVNGDGKIDATDSAAFSADVGVTV